MKKVNEVENTLAKFAGIIGLLFFCWFYSNIILGGILSIVFILIINHYEIQKKTWVVAVQK